MAKAGRNQHMHGVRGRSVLRSSGRANHHDLVMPPHLPGAEPGSDPPGVLPGEFQPKGDPL
jgi:hypothetical protein